VAVVNLLGVFKETATTQVVDVVEAGFSNKATLEGVKAGTSKGAHLPEEGEEAERNQAIHLQLEEVVVINPSR